MNKRRFSEFLSILLPEIVEVVVLIVIGRVDSRLE